MEKLKTLKDLREVFNVLAIDKTHIKIGKKIHTGGYFDIVYTKKLRPEVIKHIKFLDKELTNPNLRGLDNQQEKIIGICAILEWIKMFFNITEDEINFKNGNKIISKKSKEKIRGFKCQTTKKKELNVIK